MGCPCFLHGIILQQKKLQQITFAVQNYLISPNYFPFVAYAFGVESRNHCLTQSQEDLPYVLS